MEVSEQLQRLESWLANVHEAGSFNHSTVGGTTLPDPFLEIADNHQQTLLVSDGGGARISGHLPVAGRMAQRDSARWLQPVLRL